MHSFNRSRPFPPSLLQVIDSAAMMAYRSDAHTEEKRDSSSAMHSCLPGPIDDVNSLLINRICYGR